MAKADPLWEEAVQRDISDSAVSAALCWPKPSALAHLGPPISRRIRPGESLPDTLSDWKATDHARLTPWPSSNHAGS